MKDDDYQSCDERTDEAMLQVTILGIRKISGLSRQWLVLADGLSDSLWLKVKGI
jgi:hypothetical protein